MNKTFLIAGGDLRFAALADKLSESGRVYAAGFGKAAAISENVSLINKISASDGQADYLVLPLPVSYDGKTLNAPFSEQTFSVKAVSDAVKKNGIVFGGMISSELKSFFEEKKLTVIDYSKREEFAVLNAVATAEGAIQAAMEEIPKTLSGRKILILGAGRIAKALMEILSGFHTKNTVAARKYSDLAWAQVYGCNSVKISEISSIIDDFDVIFNTVPAMLLDEEILRKIPRNCLIIDLASKPGGVDFTTASELGVKVLWLLSLPGKVAPITSGEIIADTIKNILAERGSPDVTA